MTGTAHTIAIAVNAPPRFCSTKTWQPELQEQEFLELRSSIVRPLSFELRVLDKYLDKTQEQKAMIDGDCVRQEYNRYHREFREHCNFYDGFTSDFFFKKNRFLMDL